MDSLKIELADLNDFHGPCETHLECCVNSTSTLIGQCYGGKMDETVVKCGEIVLDLSKKFTLVCVLCASEFDHLENFGQHIYANHLEIDQSYDCQPFECLYLEEKGRKQLSNISKYKESREVIEAINSHSAENTNGLESYASATDQNYSPLGIKFESSSYMLNTYSPSKELNGDVPYTDRAIEATTSTIKCETFDPLPVKYACSLCNTEYRHKNSYVAHARKYHGMITKSMKKRIHRDTGNLIYTINKIIREKQLKRVRKMNKYRCPKCDCGFKNKEALISHVSASHGANTLKVLLRKFPCKYCGEDFLNIEERQSHKLIRHSVDAKYDCPHCDKSFKSYDGRRIHIYSHTGERPYKCPYCPKAFTVSANLKTHIFMHLQIKKHACKYCNKKFVQSTDRNIHEARHTGVKQFQCEMCGKQFITTTLLSYHRRRHENMRIYKCTICNKAYFTSTALKDHIDHHKDERIYKCATCARNFLTHKNLKQHEQTHKPNGKLFVCACGKTFKHRSAFNLHRKGHTSIDGPLTMG